MRAAFALICLPLVLTGCSFSPNAVSSPEAGLAIQGKVYGGQQPLVGAHVYLFAANTTGYGGPGIAPSSSNASVSLLSAASTGHSDSVGAYVLTTAGGAFSITGDYSCTANDQVYLYSLGGDPGAGPNSAASLMAILGNCPASGNFATATPYVVMNEVSTVAAAYAFAGFASDATHVSSASTTASKLGLKNAFASAANLHTLSTGVSLTTTPNGNGIAPQAQLNTVANILASCINTNGAITGPTTPSTCYTLFNNAKFAGSTGTTPSDTATATINIAHNPGANVASLYSLASALPPFAPSTSGQPIDFTLGIQFTDASVHGPNSVAIDASGNVWVADHGTSNISEFSNTGASLSGTTGFTGGGLVTPYIIAIDPSGNAWVSNYYGNNVSKFNSNGNALSSPSGYTGGGLNTPYGLAIDGNGLAWVSNFTANSMTELSNSGVAGSPSGGYTGGNLGTPYSVAIDTSNNVWVANKGSSSITKLSSAGAILSGANGFTGGGINIPYAVAVDGSNNVWVANYNANPTYGNSITKLDSTGAILSGANGYTGGGLNNPYSIAIDGAGNAWIANSGNNSITEISSAGTVISGSSGYTASDTLSSPVSIAIDGSGNAWIANNAGDNLTEVIGAGSPVVTPISLGVKNSTLGARP